MAFMQKRTIRRLRNRKYPAAVVRGDVTYVPLSGRALKLVEDLAREANSTPAEILGQSVAFYKMALDARKRKGPTVLASQG